jgi:hypothetical protein
MLDCQAHQHVIRPLTVFYVLQCIFLTLHQTTQQTNNTNKVNKQHKGPKQKKTKKIPKKIKLN